MATPKVLLMTQVPIGRNQDIKPARFRLGEQVPIAEDRPPHLERRRDLVRFQGPGERRRHTLIEEAAHSGRFEGTRGVLEHRARLGQGDPWEPVDEILNLSPVFQVLEQGGNGHSGTAKDPSAANASRIALDSRTG